MFVTVYDTKSILQQGYIIGRFFGSPWGFIIFLYVYLLTTTPDKCVHTSTCLIYLGWMLWVVSEFLGPAIGIIIAFFIKSINRILEKSQITLLQLFIVGLAYWFSSYLLIQSTGALAPDVNAHVSWSYIQPIIVVFTISLSNYITETGLQNNQIKIHVAIRIMEILIMVVASLLFFPQAIKEGWDWNTGPPIYVLGGLIVLAINIIILIFKPKLFRFPL